MTTITIKNDSNLNFQKKEFEDLNDFLDTLRKDVLDFNDPDFKDTVVTQELIDEAEAARRRIETTPNAFTEI